MISAKKRFDNGTLLENGKPACLSTPQGPMHTSDVVSFTSVPGHTRIETENSTYIIYPWKPNEYLHEHPFAEPLRKAEMDETPAGIWIKEGFFDQGGKEFFCSSVKTTPYASDALIRELHSVSDEILAELNKNVRRVPSVLKEFAERHCKETCDYKVDAISSYANHVAFLEKEEGFYVLVTSWRTNRFMLTAFPKELAATYAKLYQKAQEVT